MRGSTDRTGDQMIRSIRSVPPLRRLYYRARILSWAAGQSNEAKIIADLACNLNATKTFVEFGFHPVEFNCITLARQAEWSGLLIDGDRQQVEDARKIFPKRIKVTEAFLTLENLDLIKSCFPQLGVLSIDVDGNDYWFLERLIAIKPDIVCVEYNASLGLEPITVPYDPAFDRHEKHPSGWYHGASLTALAALASKNGYGLAAVSDFGGNAFFTKGGTLDPVSAWKPSLLRQKYSTASQDQQWQTIKHLSFERI